MSIQEPQNLEEFAELVLQDKLTVARFYDKSCGPCTDVNTKMDNWVDLYPDAYFVKIDVDAIKDVSDKYKTDSFPTVRFFTQGNILEEIIGGSDSNKIEEIIKSYY